MTGKKYKYPDSDKVYTLKKKKDYIYQFECGHWCTDTVFEDLIEVDDEYDKFLKSKVRIAQNDGFEISLNDINPALKPHNKLMVKWLVNGGRRACFVDRVIDQMSNPGDVVLDPFGGLMTVPYRSITKGRYGMGWELNPVYFLDGAGYCKAAESKVKVPTLFDFISETQNIEVPCQ